MYVWRSTTIHPVSTESPKAYSHLKFGSLEDLSESFARDIIFLLKNNLLMRKLIQGSLLVMIPALLIGNSLTAQTNFTFNCTKDTSITGCASSSCITLRAVIPDIHASTSTYTLNPASSIPGCFPGSIPPGGTGTPTSLTIDDRYSAVINLGFPFYFFGTPYTQLVASTNGYLSFDISKANMFSHWSISADLPSTSYDPALIMGPYHDLDPSVPNSPGQKIQYSIIGSAPHRKFVLSFYRVPMYSCNSNIENTHQITIYESTGIIEVFIYDKQICASWNSGKAIVGIQNFARNTGMMAPGRRATDPPWGTIGMNETWRFVPSAGASLFRRVELYTLGGSLVSTGTTTNPGNGTLQATFTNVCSPQGLTSYVVKSVYTKIDDPNTEVFGLDTIRVNSTAGGPTATAAASPTNCSNNSGSITVTATGGTGPYQYSLNGGAYQSGNTFTGLGQNTYTITVRDASTCTFTLQSTVNLQNNLTLNAGNDTTICQGASFPRTVATNGSVTWTPTAGVSNPAATSVVLSPQTSTTYTVTSTLGVCTMQDQVNVTVFQGATANAGPDASIIGGDVYQMQGSASTGTYVWSPSTGLSATNILNPTASPLATTTYTLTVTSPQGCVASDNMVLTVIPYCIKPMEAFTPNGDGINDKWLITNNNSACITKATAEVFNRYGAKVFGSQDYKNTWDGTYKGKPLPDGTYYYVVSFQLINGKREFLKGSLTILR